MTQKTQRISAHTIETRSRDNIRSLIDRDGTALFRDLTERDYGIDAVMELFDAGNVTGKFALLQLKGKKHKIVPLITDKSKVSCKISASNASYALQQNIPVILIYASLEEKENFYYIALQKAITADHIKKMKDGQETITIHIPIQNCIAEGIQPFFDIVNTFYSSKQILNQEKTI